MDFFFFAERVQHEYRNHHCYGKVTRATNDYNIPTSNKLNVQAINKGHRVHKTFSFSRFGRVQNNIHTLKIYRQCRNHLIVIDFLRITHLANNSHQLFFFHSKKLSL